MLRLCCFEHERSVYRECRSAPIFSLTQWLRRFDFARRGHYHAPAMAKLLTALEAPARLASRGQVIEISDEISAFSKLSEALERGLAQLDAVERPAEWPANRVSGEARFAFSDPESRDVIAAIRACTTVPQVCQRCLGAFELAITVDAKLLLASGEDLPERDGYETWEVEDERLKPIDLVDELLVMALPFAAMHEKDASCVAAGDEAAGEDDTTRPFADLRAQLEALKTPDDPASD
jgi:uncharacterized metal-binding protein YceD (DUF177 family)